jgi:alpha-tubulin suppressor-like RCC1 family protein
MVCDATCAEVAGETSVCGDGVTDGANREDCDDGVNDGTCGTCDSDCSWAEECPLGQVSSGGWHTCEVKTDGTIACWGFNASGQSTPPTGTFDSVSAGYLYTCGVKTDGTVACWGLYVH